MKKGFLLFSGIFIHCLLSAQSVIQGQVVNKSTAEPIAGSSVFISGSSKGTVTNSTGFFQLENIPPGKHDLVISSVGYETNVFSFTDTQLPLKLKIELDVKVKELNNVILEEYTEEGWDKWGTAFMSDFVGTSKNALQCKIKNEKKIRFRYYKKSNRLVAYADEPIIIENKALGYIIRYQLEDYEINFKKHTSSFAGYPLFKEIDKDRKGLQEKWQRNRLNAYNGSILHFMRSVYDNDLAGQGFEARRMESIPNIEKARVKRIYISQVVQSNPDNKQLRVQPPVIDNKDSLSYYQRVMRQPDFIDVYGQALLTADSIISTIGPGIKYMEFDNYLFVTYKKGLEEELYSRMQLPTRNPSFPRSTVTLLNEKIISVDKNGNYYNPQEFFTSGYWGWNEKICNALPIEYTPTGK